MAFRKTLRYSKKRICVYLEKALKKIILYAINREFFDHYLVSEARTFAGDYSSRLCPGIKGRTDQKKEGINIGRIE